MERLTEKAIGYFEYDLKNFNHIPGEFGTYDVFFYYSMAVRQLGKYEDTGLTPEEINKIVSGAPVKVSFDIGDEGFLTAINGAFKERFGITADECSKTISDLQSERDTLKKALEKYRKVEQWLDDMSNPLEPLKVSAALKSEVMKYNYRKDHNPESISELDGTIISALLFTQQAQETEHEK